MPVEAGRSRLVDNRKAWRQNSEETNLIDMSEREYFGAFAKQIDMFIGRTSLTVAAAFIVGYDQAPSRHSGPGLDGWLIVNWEVSSNPVWGRSRQIALPGWEGGWDLTTEQEQHVLKVLFELLDKSLAEREYRVSGP